MCSCCCGECILCALVVVSLFLCSSCGECILCVFECGECIL